MSNRSVDEDGRPMRTGTWVTASAHIITAVIGSGVLSLAGAIAQLGWVAGPAVLVIFSLIILFTSTLLADAYRHPDPVTGQRNYTYMDAVRAHLGGLRVRLCGVAQYTNLVGVTVGYTITASISMATVRKWSCFHEEDECHVSTTPYMIIFGGIQLILCQVPNFHKLSWLSILAAVMSFAYSFIGLGLSIAKLVTGVEAKTTTSATVSEVQRFWRICQAIGDIAFAYAYSTVLIEIQVFAQPIFSLVESSCRQRWPEVKFVTTDHQITIPFLGGTSFQVNWFRVVWRSAFVAVTTVLATVLPFFNVLLALIGAASFWPLTVYFPIEMYIARAKVSKFSFSRMCLQALSLICLLVSLVAAAGSVAGLIQSLKTYRPFKNEV
ncbi:unnamed protein product [Linum tenue]|uniref:Amino acid transporter transmembrane domain-containing protein n=1 Tax=Linum tenue TaxID=586396 RepID=A0AAV0KS13_9ROSI|nr:unnamed protein product [Linum tenue]